LRIQTKNGAPRNAVKIPTGRGVLKKEDPTVSANTRKAPPKRVVAGKRSL
jgi:hypothetical protein